MRPFRSYPLVQLGGATRSGSAPSRAALEAGIQEPDLDQLVEVIGGQGSGVADLGGRLVTPDSPVPAGDAAVQVPPQRVPEAGEGDKATIEFGLTHTSL